MTREILFKGKRKDTGEWTEGYFFKIWDRTFLLWGMTNDHPNMIEVIPETVSQFIGLTDRYEKKIFDTYVKFQDITESFFKDKTCIVPNGISEWLVKDCNIGTHKRDIHIELGKDMLTRNNLKAREKDEPKVYMVTHSSKEGVEDKNCIISYYILIETKTGIGVYCNFFTSKVIL